MSAPGSWFVLIEETGDIEREFVVSEAIPVTGGAAEAWAMALDVARSHQRFPNSPRKECSREIYRLSETMLIVALRNEKYRWIDESFRVSTVQLIEVHEAVAPQQDQESSDGKARGWRRRRT